MQLERVRHLQQRPEGKPENVERDAQRQDSQVFAENRRQFRDSGRDDTRAESDAERRNRRVCRDSPVCSYQC